MLRGLLFLVTTLALLLPPGWCACSLVEASCEDHCCCDADTTASVGHPHDDCNCDTSLADRLPAQRATVSASNEPADWIVAIDCTPIESTLSLAPHTILGRPPGEPPGHRSAPIYLSHCTLLI